MTVRGRRHIVGLMVAWSVGGCAVPQSPGQRDATVPTVRSGRLALYLETEPPQSFFATFDLRGTASDGELTLSTPLGSVLAQIQWRAGEVRLLAATSSQEFDSVDSLTRQLTGAALPLGAVLDWLDGIATVADGWHVDLSRLGQGRLSARRTSPEPVATLKLILD